MPVSWSEFQQLPERAESGQRYELHDGEVVAMPHPKPIHLKLRKRLEKVVESVCSHRIVALSSGTAEFWVVDPIGRTVTVTQPSGTTLYRAGDMISVLHFETPVSVDAIFA